MISPFVINTYYLCLLIVLCPSTTASVSNHSILPLNIHRTSFPSRMNSRTPLSYSLPYVTSFSVYTRPNKRCLNIVKSKVYIIKSPIIVNKREPIKCALLHMRFPSGVVSSPWGGPGFRRPSSAINLTMYKYHYSLHQWRGVITVTRTPNHPVHGVGLCTVYSLKSYKVRAAPRVPPRSAG